MITEKQYNDWLTNPRSVRVVLYEFADLRLSNRAYRAWINGIPYPYRPLVKSPLAVRSKISAGVSVGALSVINTGELDGLLDQVLHGEPLTVRWGHPDWDYGDFKVVFRGVINNIQPASQMLTQVSFYDQNYQLEQLALSQRAGETDELVPLALGTVFNVPAIQTSALNMTHQATVVDGSSYTAVRDGGVDVEFTSTSLGFQLARPAVRELRTDIDEPHKTPLQIAQYLATLNNLEEVVTRSFKDFHGTVKLGLWVGDNKSIGAALKSALEPVGIYHHINLLGQLELIHIDHTGPADHVLLSNHIVDKSIRFGDPVIPASAVNVHWQRNWSPLSESGLALRFDPDSATPADLELADRLTNEYRTMSADTSYSSSFFKPKDYYTSIAEEAAADHELQRRLVNAGVQRRPVSFTALAPGMTISTGDRVQVHHRRFGLANGQVGTVIGTDRRLGNVNQIQVEMVL